MVVVCGDGGFDLYLEAFLPFPQCFLQIFFTDVFFHSFFILIFRKNNPIGAAMARQLFCLCAVNHTGWVPFSRRAKPILLCSTPHVTAKLASFSHESLKFFAVVGHPHPLQRQEDDGKVRYVARLKMDNGVGKEGNA